MIFAKTKTEYKRPSGGFVILYAILMTTIVLTLGLSLLGVLMQQISLSGAQRESGLSFYTSDSGMECALYWDINGDSFRNATPITCDGAAIAVSGPVVSPLSPPRPNYVNETYAFNATFTSGCSDVTVIKTVNTVTDAVATTTVRSKGYNTVCPPTVSPKPWRMERGLETVY